jgi:predicted kinase
LARRLVIFCGIPGSGKTTIAGLVAAALEEVVHVQTDTIRLMIPEPAYTRRESWFVYSSLYAVGREALRRGYDAILDGTFLREENRSEAAGRLAGLYSSLLYVSVICDPATALRRNAGRGGPAVVPEETLVRLASTFEPPRRGVHIDSRVTPPEAAAELVLDAVKRSRWRPAP